MQQFGVIGLSVMGKNLPLTLEITVSQYLLQYRQARSRRLAKYEDDKLALLHLGRIRQLLGKAAQDFGADHGWRSS